VLYLLGLMFIALMAWYLPGLIRRKMWRETAAFSGLLLIAMVYSFGLLRGQRLPDLVDVLEMVFKPVTKYLEQLLT